MLLLILYPMFAKQSLIKAYQVLKISEEQAEDFQAVKIAYRKLMIRHSKERTARIKLNQAYAELQCKIFKVKIEPIQLLVINGKLEEIEEMLRKNKKLVYQKFSGYPLLYLAARSGHYDIVQLLLKMGGDFQFKEDKSTPMHCAAFYGHDTIIGLLLEYGIPLTIKNAFNDLPIEDAATDQIKTLLQNASADSIQKLQEQIIEAKIGTHIINIYDQKNKLAIKKIILKNYFKGPNWYSCDAFHGTKYEVLFSIAQNGLNVPGTIVKGKKIKTVEGHIPLGVQYQGAKDWSKAIFVSPSVCYAADPVYSKQFFTKSEVWLPVVQVKVKEGSYTKHSHTLVAYDLKDGEPQNLQFRVDEKHEGQKLIMRAEDQKSVVVTAILFIRPKFLDSAPNYQTIKDLVLNSKEEKEFRLFNNSLK